MLINFCDIPRFHYSSRHFIVPVVLYSLLYNLPKFFELTVACPETVGWTNNTNCSLLDMKIAANDMRCERNIKSLDPNDVCLRLNYWYMNVYVLWLNSLLNIILPIISLVILNINTSR